MINILGTATIPLTTMTRFVTSKSHAPTLDAIIAYWAIAHKEYGLDPAVCVAQAIHETGYFTSEWAVQHRNYCGLGVTGQGWGYAFDSVVGGVRAHCAHLLGYTHTSHNSVCQKTDPRHADVSLPGGVHLCAIATIADLNGKWAFPGIAYGDAIQAIYDAMSKA